MARVPNWRCSSEMNSYMPRGNDLQSRMPGSGTSHEIDATATSVAVLEYLVETEGHAGVSEVARELDIPKSMAYNHISTLRSQGLIVKRDRKYAPSMRLLGLGERARAEIPAFTEGRAAIENLAEATGGVVELFVMEEQYGVPLYIEQRAADWEPPHRVGERMPLHVNAAGKAMLASLPAEELRELLDGLELAAMTDQTITDPDTLESEIRRMRESDGVVSREEQYPGVVSVAAAVNADESEYRAALAIVGPADRLHGRYLEEDLLGQVVSTANELEVALTD